MQQQNARIFRVRLTLFQYYLAEKKPGRCRLLPTPCTCVVLANDTHGAAQYSLWAYRSHPPCQGSPAKAGGREPKQ